MLHLLTVYFIKMVKWSHVMSTQAQLLGAITHITLLHITCFLALDDRSKSKWPVKTEQRDRSGIFFDRWKYFNIGYCLQNLTWWNSSLKNYFEEKKIDCHSRSIHTDILKFFLVSNIIWHIFGKFYILSQY